MAENNALQALIDAGADAQTNMYDVSLEFASWNATVRAEGFDIPEISAETYQTKYHGVSYDRVKTEQTFERKFSMTFRMDAKYGLYQAFTSLLSWHVNPNNGGVANANIDKVGTVKVRPIDSAVVAAPNSDAAQLNGSPAGVESYSSSDAQSIGQITSSSIEWVFENCFVTKVGMPKYKTDSADTINFEVEFHFGPCNYPGFETNKESA